MEKRFIGILSLAVACLGVGASGGQQVIVKGEQKSMGYCFDAALNEKGDRLYVAGGQAGLHVFSVREGELQLVMSVCVEGYYRNLKILGDRLFLADTQRGLVVHNISSGIPMETWALGEKGGLGLHVEGQRVYLAWSGRGLAIFDIQEPDKPRLIGRCASPQDAWDVWVKGRYAYVADLKKGVATIDVNDPANPRQISLVTWDQKDAMAEIIRGEGSAAFVAAGRHGLVALDLGDPAHPRVASTFRPSDGSFGEGLCVRDGLVYLANGHEGNRRDNGLIIVDARKPDSLKELGRCLFLGWVEGACVSGSYAYVTNTWSGVRSIQIGAPTKPVLKDSYGPIADPYYDTHLDTPVSAEEKRQVEEFAATTKEIFEGKEFRDQSTPVRALLTLISACKSGDPDRYASVNPSDAKKRTPEEFKKYATDQAREWEKTEVVRISALEPQGDGPAFCAIYTRSSADAGLFNWGAQVFSGQGGTWQKLFNTGSGFLWRKYLPRTDKGGKKAE
jgi:hypothetical protein